MMPFTQMVELCQPYLELKNKKNWELERFFQCCKFVQVRKKLKTKRSIKAISWIFFD